MLLSSPSYKEYSTGKLTTFSFRCFLIMKETWNTSELFTSTTEQRARNTPRSTEHSEMGLKAWVPQKVERHSISGKPQFSSLLEWPTSPGPGKARKTAPWTRTSLAGAGRSQEALSRGTYSTFWSSFREDISLQTWQQMTPLNSFLANASTPPHPIRARAAPAQFSGQNSRAASNCLKKTPELGSSLSNPVSFVPHTPARATQTHVEGIPLPEKQVANYHPFSLLSTFLWDTLICHPGGPLPSPTHSLNGTISFPSLPKCDAFDGV